MTHKEDLRVTRTKKMIKDAFIYLLHEKRYEQITIQELADQAMINRNTFYLHYQTKADLLEKISEACINDLRENIYKLRLKEDVYHPNYSLETDAVFHHIEQNVLVYEAFLLKGNCPNFDTLLKSFFAGAIRQELQHQRFFDYKETYDLESYSEFCASGYLGVIILWLDNRIAMSDAKRTINQIITNNLFIT